jgi:hypothetical protein
VRIYGLDFTSNPGKKKPITCAVCSIQGGILLLESFEPMYSFPEFENFLDSEGPWVAGMNFPFGQPWKFTSGCDLSSDWTDYVYSIQQKGKHGFEELLENYRRYRVEGDKEHLRVTDPHGLPESHEAARDTDRQDILPGRAPAAGG